MGQRQIIIALFLILHTTILVNAFSSISKVKNNGPSSSDKQGVRTKLTSMNGWNKFKDGVYDVIDTVNSVRNSNKGSTNRIIDRELDVSYADTIGSKSIQAPAVEVLKEFEKSLKYEDGIPTTDLSTGDNYYTGDFRKRFDTAKDIIYDTFEGVTGMEKYSKKKAPEEEEEKNDLYSRYIKVATKPSINEDKSVQLVSSQLDNLKSQNVIKRLKARFAIAVEERRRKRIQLAKRMRLFFTNLKQFIYNIIDATQAMYYTVINTPAQFERSLVATQIAVEEAQLQIQELPPKIGRAYEDTKLSTVETIQIIQSIPKQVGSTISKTMEDVQAIPSQIEQNIVKTRTSIDKTKEGVDNFVSGVKNLTFEAKVLVGLEKPKPPPPPPPKTGKEIAIGLVGETVKLAGKGLVVVAKGTVGMGVSGAKLALFAAQGANGGDKADPQRMTLDQMNRISRAVVPNSPTARERPSTMAEVDPILEKEVEEALRVAEEALSMSTKIENKDSMKSIDINAAVRRAKEAAAQARKDASDLEAMLKDRNYFISNKEE